MGYTSKDSLISAGQKLWELLIQTDLIFFFINHSKTSGAFTNYGGEFEGFVMKVPLQPKLFLKDRIINLSYDGELINWSYAKGQFEPLRVNYPDKGNLEFVDGVKFIDEITEADLELDFRLLASEEQIRNSILNERFSVAINFAKLIYDYESRMDKLREKTVEEVVLDLQDRQKT